jgi:hypothetical protein
MYALMSSTLARYKESCPFDYVEEMGQLTIGDEEEKRTEMSMFAGGGLP